MVDLAAAAQQFRLRLAPRRTRGRVGDARSGEVGGGMEYHDVRDYVPGDDLRHLDWRGLARSDRWRIRQHLQDVAPFVELLVDDSASMMVTPQKERAARALVQACSYWCKAAGCTARILVSSGVLASASELRFANRTSQLDLPQAALRPRSVRILLTDGLWSTDARPSLRKFAEGAAELIVLQLLDPWEAAPPAGSALRLHDVESDELREVQFDAASLRSYGERLRQLCATLQTATLGTGGRYARVLSDDLAVMCRRDLMPGEIVQPA